MSAWSEYELIATMIEVDSRYGDPDYAPGWQDTLKNILRLCHDYTATGWTADDLAGQISTEILTWMSVPIGWPEKQGSGDVAWNTEQPDGNGDAE